LTPRSTRATIAPMQASDFAREVLTAAIGMLVLAGCGFLIYQGRGSEEQAWLMAGIVVTYFFNRQQQASTVQQVLRSQPSVTATPGPPAEVRVEPQDDDA
jgi:hypothetical protein